MRALRLLVHQNQACYRKAETYQNKMTFPLPPYATIIGALHAACGYNSYHAMRLSVQGDYQNMNRKMKMTYIRLNSINYTDSRGSLVALTNRDVLTGREKVIAKVNQKRGASYIKKIGLTVYDNDALDVFIKHYKNKNRDALKDYAELVRTPVGIELLHNINLVIHIVSDDKTLDEIKSNIYNLTSIGRSEDFIDLEDFREVNLIKPNREFHSAMSAFVPKTLLKDDIYFKAEGERINATGTCYNIKKNYQLIDSKRVFNSITACYISNYYCNENSKVLTDDQYIVALA